MSKIESIRNNDEIHTTKRKQQNKNHQTTSLGGITNSDRVGLDHQLLK